MKKILCCIIFGLFIFLAACSTSIQNDLKYNFNDLVWEDDGSNYYLQENILVDYKNQPKIHLYLYFPDISEYISKSSWYFNEIELVPRYLTSCPVNYVSNCVEDFNNLYIGSTIKYISFDDIENGGYFKYELSTSMTNSIGGITIGGDKRIYELTDINLRIEDNNENIVNEIIQGGMLLISFKEYSDEEIVSAFE